MGREIERKFVVTGTAWRAGTVGVPYRQGYLCVDPQRTVRIRTEGDRAVLTVKGPARSGVRSEFEYEIPVSDAVAMLAGLCLQPIIEKTRYQVVADGTTWVVDEFDGANAGLIVAEVELDSPQQKFALPLWVGADVSDDPRYLNSSLVSHPYCEWRQG